MVRVKKKPSEKPSASMIRHRFPKFVLGFVLVSVLASFGLFNKEIVGALQTLSEWAFAMAFFSIGLELSVRELGKMGWRPLAVYGAATVFNTALALGVAWAVSGTPGFWKRAVSAADNRLVVQKQVDFPSCRRVSL